MSIKISGNDAIDNNQRGIFLKVNPGVYTTSARDSLSASAGDVIYNSTDEQLQVWTGTEWSAGGSNPTKDFVASGNVSNGDTVVLNADGTVSAITSTISQIPEFGEIGGTTTSGGGASAYDPNTGVGVHAFTDSYYGSLAYPYSYAGTAPYPRVQTVFDSNQPGGIHSAVYDSANNKVVIIYKRSSSSALRAVVGTTSPGTNGQPSVTFGNSISISGTGSSRFAGAVYAGNGKVVVYFSNTSDDDDLYACVGTVSGTSISFGGTVKGTNDSQISYDLAATYDSTNDRVVFVYTKLAYPYSLSAVVGTVSGDSISFGTPVTIVSTTSIFEEVAVTFDSTNNKVVAFGTREDANTGNLSLIAAVGTVSGTSISFGTPVTITTSNTTDVSTIYDPAHDKVVIFYATNASGYGQVGTVSGTSISFDNPIAVAFNVPGFDKLSYDSFNNVVIVPSNNNRQTILFSSISRDLKSNTQVQFDTDISISTQNISMEYDSTTNRVVMFYGADDGSNVDRGTAIVGFVNGTTINFGTRFIFENSEVVNLSSSIDSGKILIAYQGDRNGSLTNGKARVGTINPSTNSINLGSVVTFDSNVHRNGMISSTFFDDTVVITYMDYTTYEGKVIVGSVSGTTITFGTPVVFSSRYTATYSIVYANNNKVVISYPNYDNSNQAEVVVGTVNPSTNSITLGNPVSILSTGEVAHQIESIYDPINDKVVIAYADGANGDYGTALVGTVSGTTISFGSPSVFAKARAYGTRMIYDSVNERILISFRGVYIPYGIQTVVGNISGTSIGFGKASSSFGNFVESHIAYDSTNNKIIHATKDRNTHIGNASVIEDNNVTSLTSGNYIGIAAESISDGATGEVTIVSGTNTSQTNLEAGKAYFVQRTGGIREFPSTPYVFAGTAASSTSIIVKG